MSLAEVFVVSISTGNLLTFLTIHMKLFDLKMYIISFLYFQPEVKHSS